MNQPQFIVYIWQNGIKLHSQRCVFPGFRSYFVGWRYKSSWIEEYCSCCHHGTKCCIQYHYKIISIGFYMLILLPDYKCFMSEASPWPVVVDPRCLQHVPQVPCVMLNKQQCMLAAYWLPDRQVLQLIIVVKPQRKVISSHLKAILTRHFYATACQPTCQWF